MEEVLKEELELIQVSNQEKNELKKIVDATMQTIKSKIDNLGIDAELFIGGSFAKGTLIKKSNYDVDIFLRFDKEYSEEQMREKFKRIFFWFKIPKHKAKIKLIHGSRDYYQILLTSPRKVCIEIIPVLKIIKPEQARNVIDLSYLHVTYVKKKLKEKPELINEILLMKAFCHGQKCYGAESYVSGFSGYALELLIIHYGSFAKLLNEMMNYRQRMIIDIAGHYQTIEEVVKSMNSSKIQCPIILIDPTLKERNTASALSKETFEKFKESATSFIKNPSIEFFTDKPVEISHLNKIAWDNDGFVGIIEIKTNKQSGDIAGTKLLKFSKFLSRDVSKNFDILKQEFEYDDKNKARVYYVLKNKSEIILTGPLINHQQAVQGFKKAHPVWYVQGNRIFSARPANITIKEFLKGFKKSNKKTIREMAIRKIKLVK